MRRRFPLFIPLLAGTLIYVGWGHPFLPIIQFELAGDASAAAEVVAGRTEEFRDALKADWFAFIPGYTLTLALIAGRERNRTVGLVILGLALFACAADMLENVQLWNGLASGQDSYFANGSNYALAKFAALIPAIVLAGMSLRHRRRRHGRPVPDADA